MLEVTHNLWLVAAAFAVAMMAGFTGLTVTRGASALAVPERKRVVAIAAVILGGGIWSMHFVAMLGLQMPILFYYDALITLISALLAILVVGLALLVLHFRPRTHRSMAAAGAIVGLGIAGMHYTGMAGIALCRPVYASWDLALSVLAAIGLSVLAIRLAYGDRSHRNILLGTVGFGLAVPAVHFIAMAGTGFVATGEAAAAGPALSNETLAMGVTVTVFLICGAFLLSGATFLAPPAESEPAAAGTSVSPDIKLSSADTDSTDPAEDMPEPPPPEPARLPQIPYEREGRTWFESPAQVAALRAEGHYTLLYTGSERLLCPWSISEAERRLEPGGFIRAHRSYLINPLHVSAFERRKDSGVCHLSGVSGLPKVPVSRSRLPDVRDALGV